VIPKPHIRDVALAASLLLACACSGNPTNGAGPSKGTDPTGSPGAGGAGTSAGGTSSAGSTSTGPDGGTTTTLPCDVEMFVREHCQTCHNSRPNHVAPMPLERREDFMARSVGAPEKTVAERVLERVTASMNPMPPDGRLSDASLAPLTDWIGAGMPAGSCTDPGPEPPRPFETLTRDSALTKVKTFLTGLAPDEAEFGAYRADPSALPGLIDGFLNSDAWKARELELFKLLFQQRTDGDDLGTYLKVGNNAQLARLVKKSGLPFTDYIEESFALTARDLVDRGRPFTETVTTRTFMLNVPLMALLAHMDARPANDLNQRAPSWLDKAYPNATVTYVKDRDIPFSDSVDPASQDFLHFSVTATPTGTARLCGDALDQTYTGYRAFDQIWLSEVGLPGNDFCWTTSPVPTLFTPADREFRAVTVRLAKNGEKRTLFWDLDSLRKTPELVLGVEYVERQQRVPRHDQSGAHRRARADLHRRERQSAGRRFERRRRARDAGHRLLRLPPHPRPDARLLPRELYLSRFGTYGLPRQRDHPRDGLVLGRRQYARHRSRRRRLRERARGAHGLRRRLGEKGLRARERTALCGLGSRAGSGGRCIQEERLRFQSAPPLGSVHSKCHLRERDGDVPRSGHERRRRAARRLLPAAREPLGNRRRLRGGRPTRCAGQHPQ
jgi:hypothetical protein